MNLDKLKSKCFDESPEFFVDKDRFQLSHTHSFLYNLNKEHNFKNYGEIGSHVGNSALCILLSSNTTKVNCFDFPNSGWGGSFNTNFFLDRILGKYGQGRASLTLGNSHSIEIKNQIKENGLYDLFLVDGDHSDKGAMEDLEVAYDNLNPGGYLIFDDIIHHPSLETVFDNFVEKIKPFNSYKIKNLNNEEKNNNYLLRGIGVLIK